MDRKHHLACGAGVLASACLMPTLAEANAGLPMLALTWPIAINALVPVIVIEAYVFKRRGFPFGWSLKWNAIANAASTLVGIPLAWIAYAAFEMGAAYALSAMCPNGCPSVPALGLDTVSGKALALLMTAPWLPPWGSEQWPIWLVPTAFLILLVVFFFVSWRVETSIIRGFNSEQDRKVISRTCLYANAITYALLGLFPVSLFFKVQWPDWIFWVGRLIW